MSISETAAPNDGEAWFAATFRERGPFTALVVLAARSGGVLAPLCSTSLNVVGPQVAWDDLVIAFAGSGQPWDAAAFFPRQNARGRPLGPADARLGLRDLESRLDTEPTALSEASLFSPAGERVAVQLVPP